MILLAVLMIASVSYGENGPSPLITPSSVSGLGTIATVDSPVPVANGGTGATTADLALSNLGTQAWTAEEKTQALVGSATVNFSAQKTTIGTTTLKIISGTEYFVMAPDAVVVSSVIGSSTLTSIIGRFFIHDGYYTNGAIGDIYGKAPVITGQTSTLFSETKDNAATINIYYEGTNIKIQNKRAVTVLVTFGFSGMR
jgi:hypothetical protein